MNNKLNVLAVSLAVIASGNAWADSQEEVNKQIAKLIGDAISTRVSSTAGAQEAGKLPNNVWASYSRLRVDPEGASSVGTDIGVAGYDRDLSKDWVVGVALSYSDSNRFSANSWSVSPYAAYLFTKQIYGVVRLGHSEFDARGSDGDTDNVAVSLNGIHHFGNLYGQWRAEVGFSDTDTKAAGIHTSSSATSYIGDGELGYNFGGGWKGFVGLQLSDTNRKDSYNAFARIGLEKEIGKDAAISAKYEGKIDDNAPSNANVKIDTFTIAARIRF